MQPIDLPTPIPLARGRKKGTIIHKVHAEDPTKLSTHTHDKFITIQEPASNDVGVMARCNGITRVLLPTTKRSIVSSGIGVIAFEASVDGHPALTPGLGFCRDFLGWPSRDPKGHPLPQKAFVVYAKTKCSILTQ